MNQIPRAAPVRQYRLGLIIRRQQETNPISPASLVHQRQLTASKSSSLSSYSSSSSLYSSAFSSYHSFHAHHSLFSNRASKASGNHHQQRHHHQRNKRRQFSSTAAMLEGDMPIYIILGINGIIFLSWNYADSLRKRFNDSTLYSFLVRNFLLSYDNVQSGRVWTIITNCFSHSDTTHFLINSLVLYSFGPAVVQIVGARRFIGLYLASGIASSVGHLVYHKVLRPIIFGGDHQQSARWPVGFKQPEVFSHGASGCISACSIIFALTYPKAQLQLFFFLPVPAAVAVGGFFVYDFYRALTTRTVGSGQTNYAAHVGGGLFGVWYWYTKLGGRSRRW